jgi:uncharacterized protein (DUF1330 family)
MISNLDVSVRQASGDIMKIWYIVALSMVAGAALGGAAIQGLHAQAKPPVYVVNEVDVTDKAGFQTYAANQETLIKKHGGQYIIRGGKVVATLSGTPPLDRFTVYRFDSQEKMQAWRDDPAQKDGGLAARDKVGKFRSFVVEGLPQ